MLRTAATRHFQASLSLLILILPATAAHADPIQPSYTLTDLGSGHVTYGTDASGSGTVIAPDGQTRYPFPQTFAGTWIPTPANFPVLTPAPSAPNSMGYSSASIETLYPNGIAIALDRVNLSTASISLNWQRTDVYSVQRNADGSWGQPVLIAQGPTNYGTFPPPGPGVGAALNKSGDMLTLTLDQWDSSQYTSRVYNINTGFHTNLSTLPALVDNGFSNIRAFSSDDDGRILLTATRNDGEDEVLLTPAGITSDPIKTPEPASLAVMAMAMAAFAIHRTRRRG